MTDETRALKKIKLKQKTDDMYALALEASKLRAQIRKDEEALAEKQRRADYIEVRGRILCADVEALEKELAV